MLGIAVQLLRLFVIEVNETHGLKRRLWGVLNFQIRDDRTFFFLFPFLDGLIEQRACWETQSINCLSWRRMSFERPFVGLKLIRVKSRIRDNRTSPLFCLFLELFFRPFYETRHIDNSLAASYLDLLIKIPLFYLRPDGIAHWANPAYPPPPNNRKGKLKLNDCNSKMNADSFDMWPTDFDTSAQETLPTQVGG